MKKSEKSIFSHLLRRAFPIYDEGGDALRGLESWSELTEEDYRRLFSISEIGNGPHEEKAGGGRYFDYIFAGCSETTGWHLGVDPSYESVVDFIWGTIVGRGINLEGLNMSFGGANVLSLVTSLTRHFRLYGPPKHVAILFPRISSRLSILHDPKYIKTKTISDRFVKHVTGIGDLVPEYSKKPHDATEVLPQTLVSYINIQSILMLEELCVAHGIDLIYSTWSASTDAIFEAANESALIHGHRLPFPNYIKSDYNDSFRNGNYGLKALPNTCHADMKDHPMFEEGIGWHMGTHAHAHVAANFIEELTKRGYITNL